jgi:RNA polymerase sigma factor (sigma-70 family)
MGMPTGGIQRVLDHLRLADRGLTDAQLLTRFLDGREEAAFAALVRRHGPMVLGVCRRILGHAHDAEDAFQATFFILARKAAAVAKREAVGSFLYGVAYRTALRARAHAIRRRATERQVSQMPHPAVAPPEAQDWRPLLDRELSRLPEKYRAALVLCDLECKSRREAARQLGLPEGTLASRLATARRMLARRLAKRGLALSGGALAVALAERAAAAVPAPWISATARAATQVVAGQTAAVATPAALLMNEVLKAMLLTKLKLYVVAVVAAVLLGAAGLAYRAAAQAPQADARPLVGQAPQGDARPLTDLEVLRREVEILKLQMEVLQAKVRSQEAELRALRGQTGSAGHRPKGATGPVPEGERGKETLPGPGPKLAPSGYPGSKGPQPEGGTRAGPALPQAAEAALKVLREAHDPRTRQEAADTLERELRRMGQQLGPTTEVPHNVPK